MTDEKPDVLQRIFSLARILVPLIGIILVVLQWWQNAQLMDEAKAANQAMRQIWVNHPPEFPLDTLASAVYVPSAVSPLGAFDPGEGPWLAQSIWLQLSRIARGQDQLGYDVFPSGRQVGMNAATFAQFVISCLALLLGWRQARGGRSLSLQWGTSLQTTLIEFSGPTVAICCLLTAVLQRQSLGIEGALRLILVLGIYVLYAIAAGTICWLTYNMSKSLSRASSMLVLFWLINFSLARPFTVNLAAAVFRLPTLDQYAKKLEFENFNGYNGVEPRADRQRRFVNEILREYKVSAPADVPVNISALVLQREERHQREVGTRLRAEIDDTFLKQERLEQAISILFPLVAIQLCSSSLSATDFLSERQQLNDSNLFWDKVVAKVYADVAVASGPQAMKLPRGPDYWSQFPFVEVRLPDPMRAISACLMPALGLALFGLGGMLVAFRAKQAPMIAEEAE